MLKKNLPTIAFFISVLMPSVIHAADCTWTSSSGNWNLSSNWSCGAVPTASDNVFIPIPGDYTVTLDVNAEIANLTLGEVSVGTQTLSTNGNTLIVNNTALINNTGALIINAAGNNSDVTVASGFTNDGAIVMESSGGAYSTSLTVSTGTLTNTGTINANVGTGGSRTISADINNQGAIKPGGAGTAGTLTVTGNLTQTTGSVIEIDIGGTAAGEFDNILISGVFNLGGTLKVNLINSFTPTLSDTFTIINHTGGSSGLFAAFDLPPLVGNNWSPIFNVYDTGLSIIADSAAPAVLSTNPPDTGSYAPVAGPIFATFSDAMDPATINAATFTVTGSSGNVSGTVTYMTEYYGPWTGQAKFTLSTLLVTNSTYTATITTAAKDLAGNAIPADFVWSFTTTPGTIYVSNAGVSSDGTINYISTDGNTVGNITIGDEPRLSPDGSYLAFRKDYPANNIYVRNLLTEQEAKVFNSDNTVVNYGWTSDSVKILFDYAGGSTGPCGVYQMDRDGTGIQQITGLSCGDLAPVVNPVDGRIAFFNSTSGIGYANADGTGRTIVAGTTTGDSWPAWSPDGQWISYLAGGSVQNYYKIMQDGSGKTQLTFAALTGYDGLPAGPWTSDGNYIIAPGKFEGNADPVIYAIPTNGSGSIIRIYFTEGSAGEFVGSVDANMTLTDNVSPEVIGRTPASGATNVPTNTVITATFNESMIEATVTNATFTVDGGAGAIAGTVAYDASTHTATFTPSARLNNNTPYTVNLTSGITDATGNALSPVSWSFTTAGKIMWNLSTGGDWNVPANWSPATLPTATDEVEIGDGCINCTVILNVNATVLNLILGGTLSTQTLSIGANTLTLSSASIIYANGVLTQSGGTVTGPGSLIVYGAFNWTGGTMSGAGSTDIQAGGMFAIAGTSSYKYLNTRTINNSGTVTYTPTYYLQFEGAAVWNNLNGGVFDIQSDTTINTGTGGGTFINQSGAIFKKSVATVSTAFNPVFNNNGSVDIQSGTVELNGGGTSTGSFTASVSSAKLSFGGSGKTHTVSSPASFSGAGTIEFTGGTTTIESGATYSVTGVTSVTGGTVSFNNASSTTTGLNISGGALSGSGTVNTTTATWTGGTMSGTGSTDIASGGTLGIGGTSSYKYLDTRTINNNGTATYTATYYLSFQSGGIFKNLNGSVFDIQTDTTINTGTGGGTFNNQSGAIFKKTVATGTTTFNPMFNNSGSVDIQSGTVELNGGGTSTGSFTASVSSAKLSFGGTGKTHTVSSPASFSGPGTIEFTGGTTTIDSGVTYNITGTTSVTGGTVNFNNASSTTAGLTVSGGSLSGSGTINTTTATWTGGTMSGTGSTDIASGGTLGIGGASSYKYLDTRTINNNGTATYTATYYLSFQNSGIFNNLNGGVFDIQTDTTINTGTGGGAFNNQSGAIFRKTVATVSTAFNPVFNNSGSVDIQSGTVELNGGGTSTGSFTASVSSAKLSFGGTGKTHTVSSPASFSGAGTIEFTGGTTTIDSGVTYNVAGTTSVTGGTVSFNTNSSTSALSVAVGTLSGSGVMTVTGTFDWQSGKMTGGGTTTIETTVTSATLSTAGAKYLGDATLGSRSLTNKSTLNWANGAIYISHASTVLDNQGSFDIQLNSNITYASAAGTIANSGTIIKSSSSGVNVSPSLTNTGTIDIQAGTLTASGAFATNDGTIQVASGTTFQKTGGFTNNGTISGAGAVNVGLGNTLVNSGSIETGGTSATGQLAVTGNLSQSSASIINIEIGGTTAGQYDVLDVSSATLNGAINVSLINSFVPNIGDSFTVMNYASKSGSLTSKNLPSLSGKVWNVTEGATSLVLSVAADSTPPTGTIAINSGAAYTNSINATLTLTCADASGCAEMQFSNDNTNWSTPETFATSKAWALSTGDGTKTVYVKFNDGVGNWSSDYSANITLDTAAPAFTSTAPATNGYINTPTFGYTLSETISSGGVTITWTGGNADTSSPHVYNFTSSDMTAGSHTVNTGYVLVNGAVYTISFDALDAAGNAAATVSNTNITYDTASASATISSPASSSIVNNSNVGYTLSEAISSGNIVFTATGGNPDALSPHTYTLAGGELAAGTRSVTTGITLVDGAVYTVSVENVFDAAGNATATVSNTSVTYDSTAVAITGSSPAANAVINTATVGYTLSEQAQSGKVTFTRTGGSADAGSPHIYNLGGAELYSGAQTIYTGLPLIDGAIYTVSFDATDMAGNAATTLSNANVRFDSTAPSVSATNPANGATTVSTSSSIIATFIEDMDASTINGSTFTISGGVVGSVTYDTGTKTAIFTPSVSLTYSSTYSATLTTGVKDLAGNAMAANYIWSFTTSAAPDTTPPTGTIFINGGAAYTNSTSVILTLSCSDASGCSQMQFSNDNTNWSTAEVYAASKAWTLSSGDGTKTVYVKFKDAAGNWSSAYSANITLDTAAPVFTSTAPSTSGYINTSTVGYTLNKTVSSGSVTITWTGGNADTSSPHVYNFTSSDMTAGSHTVNTGFVLVNGAVYTISFAALDAAGNAAATVSNTNITYDTASASATISSPASSSIVNNSNVGYTLSEAISSGNIVFTATGGNPDALSPHIYTLAGGELTAGDHSVTTGITIVDGAVYTVSIENVFDAAGNPTATVSNTGITYDSTSVAITGTFPTANAVISTATVSYTLSEAAQNGKVTFTWTSGNADAGSQHIYTLAGSELYLGTTTLNAGLPLVDGAIYTVSFDATDMAGNAATTVSNANVRFDSTAPSVSATNPANGATTVSISSTIKATFIEDMDASTINGSSFTVSGGVEGSVAYDAGTKTATFTPSAGLAYNSAYSATLTTGVKDLAGNAMEANYIWSFATSAAPDTIPPTGTIFINSDAAYTNSTSVTLTLLCSDASGCSQMQFSNDNANWSTAVLYATSMIWTLSSGDGTKTVYAKFKDGAGNWSSTNSDIISLDTAPPLFSSVSPAYKEIMAAPTVVYRLSEGASSGKVTFTRSGGATGGIYSFTEADITAGLHTVNVNLPLVDGAFYTVTFEAKDAAGNAATAVSVEMVFYDSSYGKGPAGNVDNSGTSANRVDGSDLIKLGTAYNSRAGDFNWNPICDLDRNNFVDGNDLMILGVNFGK